MRTLKKGSVGDDVKTLQKILGVTVDGYFGSQTEAAVKKWQAAHGIVADGIVGAKTWASMSEQTTDIPDVIYDPLNVHITKASNREIKYIAIHYTAGISSRKGSARAVKSVFTVHKSSADFAVDDAEAVQFNPDFVMQVAETPKVVVADEQMHGNARIGKLGQFALQPDETLGNHGLVLKPKVEQVAH